MAGLVYPERAALLLVILTAVIRIAVPQNVALQNVEPRNAAIRIVATPSAVIPNAVIPNAVIQIAVIHAVALIVVPILVLNAVLIVAAIQASIPARDARSADSREELHEEYHVVVPIPALVVPSLARACWQEHSRLFPVDAHVFPIHRHGRDLGVAEAQAVLQRHLVEFLRWSQEQELLLVLLAPLRLVDSLRALSARVRERLLTF